MQEMEETEESDIPVIERRDVVLDKRDNGHSGGRRNTRTNRKQRNSCGEGEKIPNIKSTIAIHWSSEDSSSSVLLGILNPLTIRTRLARLPVLLPLNYYLGHVIELLIFWCSSVSKGQRKGGRDEWSAWQLGALLQDLSNKLRKATGDARAGVFLRQNISLAVQRGNAVNVIATAEE
ncbi:hypothetical protein ACOME3_000926 [Neoechinorhynchus agilis]